ncbi:hypothetical protein [Actinoplanes sp. L3-i22]|uniref:hypothetical protein n=1 Tax=Actinoplanes sp. L3-i22 TaxID=2836373 RepID=UPI001C857EDD|nr:hypothetical protein [Actinoplanes sp. L3-i22]
MSPRTARLLVLPFALAACALDFATHLWIQPLAWRLGSGNLAFVTAMAILAASAFLPLGLYLLVARRARKPPAVWQRPGAGPVFSAGPAARVSLIWVGWVIGSVVPTERVPNEARARLVEIDPVVTVFLVIGLLTLILLVVTALSDRPVLELTPDGITGRDLLRRRRAGWDDEPFKTPRWLHIDPAFLAFTLDFYRTRPERRAEIGTEAGAAALAAAYRPA